MSDTAAETVASYYRALRAGDPLGPYFADTGGVVKFGISERLLGHDAVVAGLREQTETTTNWTAESRALEITEREAFAWFHDDVHLAWTDTRTDTDHDFETRWSGTLERTDDGWRFVSMHVSAPYAGEL
jgi:hypothetical protein